VTRLAADVLLHHGFEPQMSVSLATERSLICVTTISFDRSVPGQDERAQRCYDDLVGQLLARGYPPYRLNVSSMHHAAAGEAYGDLLSKLKQVLDPEGILAPGRYQPNFAYAEVSASSTLETVS
jgi:4-cresol dehydrogenase (hydroxylating)